MNDEIKDGILKLAEPLARAEGLEVWGLDVTPGPTARVRLFIDAPLEDFDAGEGGQGRLSATIDQCERISRALGLALEVEDLFPGPWNLEVSSPGLERKFYSAAQARPYVGDVIEAALWEPLAERGSRKVYKGKLLAAGDDFIELEPCSIGEDGRVLPENIPPVRIPFKSVRNARRVHIFAAPKKPRKGKA